MDSRTAPLAPADGAVSRSHPTWTARPTIAAVSIHYANIFTGVTAFGSLVAAGIAGRIAAKTKTANVDAARAAEASVEIGKLLLAATEAQARSAEAAAKAGEDAARAAEASVQTAASMARVEEMLANIEIDRRHDEMFPDVTIGYQWESHQRTGQISLFACLTNRSRRDYQVAAELVLVSNGRQSASDFTLGAGQTHRFHVGDDGTRLPLSISLEFDSVEACPCPRRTESGRHWARAFAVPQDPPRKPVTVPNQGGQRL